MNDKLKKFVSDQRKEFDANLPSKELWNKIDAEMELKNHSRIRSKRLLKFKYFGFSASILFIVLFFIKINLKNSSVEDFSTNKVRTTVTNSKQILKTDRKENNIPNEIKTVSKNEIRDTFAFSTNNSNPELKLKKGKLLTSTKNPTLNFNSFEKNSSDEEKIKSESSASKTNSINEKKENSITTISKKTELYIPPEPDKMNIYTGTLYQGSFICALLHAYKFPGKIMIDRGKKVRRKLGSKETLRTLSCSRLETIKDIKAVWLKGKTNKEITLLLKEGFKDIVLVKKDGRKLTPEAISHYYEGLGVIKDYKGKDLPLIFKEKVELILFFKNIEEGDMILINDQIETVVKNKP